ncbi:fructosamine kinase family protein [Spirilliplanes yamanashiensis]|uniref:Fructosamine kinase n=1 Tax=Spirilliplanes yamanashiensis TaxID=42233 RepID=A0A8J3Y649_9ACTN|nr:fructosamine kinase family protein [Spirilliplanes yamanashiensis]MDP9814887.1 fructosamine-3-kinase [Spirilliplanes yamanashiensis]GIJ02541.1 fructosamine kinase [Spirilliplanes yamanashiensis]
MDLGYLRAHPQHLPTFLTHQRIRETPVPGGDVCAASRLTLDDGASLFAKTFRGGEAPPGFFAAEAAGLRWLGEAGGAPVPEVVAELPALLALEWLDAGEPTAAAAERFGRELAATHRAGAAAFGAPWPGFIGPLPQDNSQVTGPWAPWFAERRLLPYLRSAADSGALSAADVAAVERVVATIEGYDEPPARLHGDLWPGNVLWGADGRAWLVDPAAHGGHRETDLAQLALFGGAPHLDRIVAAYDEVWPLGDGWRDRVPLHQLHLLLVHAAAFGGSWAAAVRSAAASLGG